MTAVDTNIVVRFMTRDDPEQAAAAKSIFAEKDIWISKTVILEVCWVLTSVYGFDEISVGIAFRKLFGFHNIQAEDALNVASALALVAEGIGFADAMHLASRPAGSAFVSFDKKFILRAKRARVANISLVEI